MSEFRKTTHIYDQIKDKNKSLRLKFQVGDIFEPESHPMVWGLNFKTFHSKHFLVNINIAK